MSVAISTWAAFSFQLQKKIKVCVKTSSRPFNLQKGWNACAVMLFFSLSFLMKHKGMPAEGRAPLITQGVPNHVHSFWQKSENNRGILGHKRGVALLHPTFDFLVCDPLTRILDLCLVFLGVDPPWPKPWMSDDIQRVWEPVHGAWGPLTWL